MTKMKFILALNDKLSGLPKDEIEERLNFYSEMIEDRIEEGLSEEEAVLEIGSVDEIAEQIVSEIPLMKIAKEKIKPQKKFKVWEVTLLILGSPIWLSLLIALFSVVLSLYVSLWTIIISLWAVFVSIVASAFASIFAGIIYICLQKVFIGCAFIGVGFVLFGLSILSFLGCKELTKITAKLTKKIIFGIKKSFIKKENV